MPVAELDRPRFVALPFRAADLARMSAEDATQWLLRRAADLRASDLFLLSEERYITVAVRRLGAIERLAVVATELGRQMMTYIKTCSDMDICEKRRPADGRWIVDCEERRLDLRLNFTPTLHGEDLTIRVCDRTRGSYRLEELGLSQPLQASLTHLLSQPGGLFLVTGPTGAGKTTTLYACLRFLNDGTRKINTLEDPIEYALEGVRQSQVNPRLGLDFPELFRHILRQAPDVVMIGEIRDAETMTTAIRAANSGQLVLATLHSPTATGAISTMLALDAHPHFLAVSLLGVLSQRLLRLLCPACRQPLSPAGSPSWLDDLAPMLDASETARPCAPRGCEHCFQTGFAGRIGAFELMPISGGLRQLIANSAPMQEIRQEALRGGMIDLRHDALLKAARGLVSPDEVQYSIAADLAD